MNPKSGEKIKNRFIVQLVNVFMLSRFLISKNRTQSAISASLSIMRGTLFLSDIAKIYWEKNFSFLGPYIIRPRNLKTEISLGKRIKYFPSTLRRKKFKTDATITDHFLFAFEENSVSRKYHDYGVLVVSIKLSFSECFLKFFQLKFFKFPGLRFRKARFSWQLVWTEDFTVEIKQRFQIPPS